MGLGYCKHHKSDDIKDNIFEYEDDQKIVECPVCHKKMKAMEATTAYADVLSKYIYKGRYYLFVISNYEKAYRMFARVLDLDEWNVNGYAGRILSLFMMSTLRNPRFEDSGELIGQAFSVLSKRKTNHKLIIILFDKLNEYIDKYLKYSKKKLMHKIYFHNKQCVELYLKRVVEAKELRKIVLKEINTLKNRNPDENIFEEIYNKIQSSITQDEITLSSYHLTTSGYSYKSIFDKKDEMVIIDDGIKQKTNLSAYHPCTLNYKEKGKIFIRDRVFPSFNAQYKFFIITFIVLVLFYVGSGFSFYEMVRHEELKLLLFIVGAVCFFIATAFVVLRLILFTIMRKRLRS